MGTGVKPQLGLLVQWVAALALDTASCLPFTGSVVIG